MRLTNQKKTSEVSLLLTNDKEIQNLNKKYRNIDAPTDVLAFSQVVNDKNTFETIFPDEYLLGDIVISVETAQRQAFERKHSLLLEIVFLTIHGFLHLLGYDHYAENEKKEMRDLENFIMENVLNDIKIE